MICTEDKATFEKNFKTYLEFHLNSSLSCFLVAKADGRIVAACIASTLILPGWQADGISGLIEWMCVHPSHKNKKIGSLMLSCLESIFFSCGAKRMMAFSGFRNKIVEKALLNRNYKPIFQCFSKEA